MNLDNISDLESFWAEQIKSWQSTDLTQRAYCQKNALPRMRLENMLDINHELIKLSKHIDWESLDKEWGALFVSTKGAPAIRTRLIAGLHYLKHLHDLSDEQVVKGWTENPYWQYFCGEEYFQHKMPIHPTTMTKWRNRLGKST